MPSVATMSKPRSTSRLTGNTIDRLSRLATETNTDPFVGSTIDPVPACDFANAAPNPTSMPMTSPVERISGPSRESTPGKRSKGSTASLTAMCFSRGPCTASSSGTRPSLRRCLRLSPAMTRAATLASGTPVVLETKGTVREARGLASMQKIVSSLTANWTLTRPRTPSPSAMPRENSRIWSTWLRDRVIGGSEQAESPECTPASSMCSSTPPTNSSSPSNTASTSTSTAPSRNRSTRIDTVPVTSSARSGAARAVSR